MKQQIEEYQINSWTMFLEPVEYGSKIFSRIVEYNDEYLSPLRPIDIIKKSCIYFGVDYESRKRGTRHLVGYNRKIPIAIEPTTNVFFFPTISPTSAECIWISPELIEDIHRAGPQKTQIYFRNKQSHLFPVPYGTIEGQILKTALLKTKLLQRIETNERKLFYLSYGPQPEKASENSQSYHGRVFLKD